MEKQTVFVKRYPSKGELPKKAGYYDTNLGRLFLFYVNEKFDRPKKYYPKWWLEKIELPSKEEIKNEGNRCWRSSELFPFNQGVNFILNKLKGE